MLSITVLIHRNILSAQCYIWYCSESHLFDALKFDCHSTDLSISILHKGMPIQQCQIIIPKNLFYPLSLSTIPKTRLCSISENHSCDCLRNQQTLTGPKNYEHLQAELSFRLDILKSDHFETLLPGPIVTPVSVKDLVNRQITVDSPCSMVCAHCQKDLMNDTLYFEKVEECCNGLVSELSEGWFCHATTVQPVSLSPKSLYFDSVFFYLHPKIVEVLNVCGIGKSSFKCNACGSNLAEENKLFQSFTKFYCDKILFRSSGLLSKGCALYRLEMAWASLWSLIQSSQKVSLDCRLYLRSKNTEQESETCLLLRVFPEKVPLFLIRGNVPQDVDFKLEHVYKVLYYIGEPLCEIVRSWGCDINVDYYKVSDSAMNVFTEFLKASSKYIPGGSEMVNGLSQGCLPTHFPKT